MKQVAVILAAGRSSRFGSEKAVADLAGRPMIAWVADVLAEGCEGLAVNARQGSGAATWAIGGGRRLLPDPPGLPDGPLTGVLAGLRWAVETGADLLFTAPCDTPRLPPDLTARLAGAITGGEACAYAASAEGSHPLCAAWRVDRLTHLEAVLANGHPSVRALLDDWGAARVSFPKAADFFNINTPADASTQARTAP